MKCLTKAEEQVMMALWSLGKGFLKDIMDQMPKPKPHSNTVATVLKVLAEKEFVQTETHGRNNLYLPCISKALYGTKTVNQLVKGYFNNSPSQLLSHLIKDEQISMEELEQLLQQVRSSKKAGK